MKTLPMLAIGIDKAPALEFPAWIQPKLDGHRAIVVKEDGKCTMHTRTGVPIETMGHILGDLNHRMRDGDVLDGELYCHDTSMAELASLVAKQGSMESACLIKFYCFDSMSEGSFATRFGLVEKLLSPWTASTYHDAFVIVETLRCKSLDQAHARAIHWIGEGYEGAILRLPDHRYMNAMRSDRVLKIKAKHLAALAP